MRILLLIIISSCALNNLEKNNSDYLNSSYFQYINEEKVLHEIGNTFIEDSIPYGKFIELCNN